MKWDKYNVMQSSRSIENLIKEFFQYKDNFRGKDMSIFCGIDFRSISKEESKAALMKILNPIMGLK